MRKLYFILYIIILNLGGQLKAQTDPQLQWVFNAVDSEILGGDSDGKDIITDAVGNKYVTGIYNITQDFDPGVGIVNITAISESTSEAFLAKYDVNGNYLWVKVIKGYFGSSGNSLALDSNGDVYLTGRFMGRIYFTSSISTDTYYTQSASDIFLAKYDADGNYLWSKQIGGSGGSEIPNSMILDNSNNVYITGSFTGNSDFDPSASNANITSKGATDAFLAKYDANGNYIWATGMGGINSDSSISMNIDNSSIYIAGNFMGTSDFNPSSGVANLTSVGNNDVFFAKYDTNGNYIWAESIGGPLNDNVKSLTIDSNSNIYLSGIFSATSDFDPSLSNANLTASGGSDIFLAKYNLNGNYLWAKRIGGTTSFDTANSLAVDSSNKYLCYRCLYRNSRF
ncbi:SBBP repeat-containing protein [Flavobacterium sp.]|uniref:SBBP repeat-containing protein n=1 Tax=Flavobacterium sp. TaxID=239 RepID=UPI0026220D3D|nr:SBBP repeat-containing protein [Flavobacterium sp.]